MTRTVPIFLVIYRSVLVALLLLEDAENLSPNTTV
jgi:hypothetical protein